MTQTILIPKEISCLQSERLLLRAFRPADAADYFEYCSDPEVMAFWGAPVHASIEETQSILGKIDEAFYRQESIRWAIIDKSAGTSKIIGDIGFWRLMPERLRAEIAAKLHKTAWNRGIISEATTMVMNYGFEQMNLNSIEGYIDPDNVSSLRVFEKIGFEREGYLKSYSYDSYTRKFKDAVLFTAFRKRA